MQLKLKRVKFAEWLTGFCGIKALTFRYILDAIASLDLGYVSNSVTTKPFSVRNLCKMQSFLLDFRSCFL